MGRSVKENSTLSSSTSWRTVFQDGTTKIVFNRIPTLDEVPYPVRMEPNLVIEFYSR